MNRKELTNQAQYKTMKATIKSTGKEVKVKSSRIDRYDPTSTVYELEDDNGTVWNGMFLYWNADALEITNP